MRYLLLLSLLVTTNLYAQADVTFTWTPVVTDILGNASPVSGYKLYLSKSSFIPVAQAPTVVTTGQNATATTRLDSGTWYGQVSAYNTLGESVRSNILSFAVPKMVPSGPTMKSAGVP